MWLGVLVPMGAKSGLQEHGCSMSHLKHKYLFLCMYIFAQKHFGILRAHHCGNAPLNEAHNT